jgi:hypothetical protein
MSTPQERAAARLFLASRDLEEALQFANVSTRLAALRRDERPSHYARVMEALQIATMISYARPFLDSDGAGKATPKIQSKGLFKDGEDLKVLHHSVLERRNQAIAHADWKYHQTQLWDMSVPHRLSSRPDLWTGVEPHRLQALILHVAPQLRARSSEADVRLLEQRVPVRYKMDMQAAIVLSRNFQSSEGLAR